jgi:hypothetical protein
MFSVIVATEVTTDRGLLATTAGGLEVLFFAAEDLITVDVWAIDETFDCAVVETLAGIEATDEADTLAGAELATPPAVTVIVDFSVIVSFSVTVTVAWPAAALIHGVHVVTAAWGELEAATAEATLVLFLDFEIFAEADDLATAGATLVPFLDVETFAEIEAFGWVAWGGAAGSVMTDITPLIFSVIVATEAPPDAAWAELTRVEVFGAWEALVADASSVTSCDALLS